MAKIPLILPKNPKFLLVLKNLGDPIFHKIHDESALDHQIWNESLVITFPNGIIFLNQRSFIPMFELNPRILKSQF